jgi:hypothetical protein
MLLAISNTSQIEEYGPAVRPPVLFGLISNGVVACMVALSYSAARSSPYGTMTDSENARVSGNWTSSLHQEKTKVGIKSSSFYCDVQSLQI